MQYKKVCVIGLGYIGLPTAALLASKGYKVIGVDVNHDVVTMINQGRIHIIEPDLEHVVRSVVSAGNLNAYTVPQSADVYIICVPTPFYESRGDAVPQPNIEYVLDAVESISGLVKPGDFIILESTSPVGTTKNISDALENAGIDVATISIAYCPERVLPGSIMRELVENDRIVGGLTPLATKNIAMFYRSFVQGNVLETDDRTGEMCKLTENSFRDVNIAFANELSIICSKNGVNVWDLILLANRHPRVNILQPGAGVGGHCIAVDPWFIVASDPENSRLIHTARNVNNYKTQWVVDQISAKFDSIASKLVHRPRIACLGLSFKPNIDDLRESPAVRVASSLLAQGFDLMVVEPNINEHPDFTLVELAYALEMADLIVVLVKHREFLAQEFYGGGSSQCILDFCGVSE